MCDHRQENICQTTAVSHPHPKHTCSFANAQAHRLVHKYTATAQPCKQHAKQAPPPAAPWWGLTVQQGTTLLSNAKQKISSYKDTSSSSSCQNKDYGLFPACCTAVWILQAKTNENHVLKNCALLNDDQCNSSCLSVWKTSIHCNLSFWECVWMWVCVLVLECTFLDVSAGDFSCTYKLLCMSVCTPFTYVCVCVQSMTFKIVVRKLWSIDDCPRRYLLTSPSQG